MVESVLDFVHSVEVKDGVELYSIQFFLDLAIMSEFYSQDLVWIEMMVVVDHKLQMVVACFFFHIGT